MDINDFIYGIQSANKYSGSIEYIASLLSCANADEMFDLLRNISDDEFIQLIETPNFVNDYRLFLEEIIESLRTVDDYTKMSICIRRNIKTIKELLKPYNKDLKSTKDSIYSKLNSLLNGLKEVSDYNDSHQVELHEDNNAKVLIHIIFDYKDIDALYYYLSQHGEVVNVYYNEEHIAAYVIRYFLNNINNLSDKDIEYYKRVITSMLLSNYIEISDEVIEELKTNIMHKLSHSDKNRVHYKYILYMLNKFDKTEIEIPNYNNVITRRIIDDRLDLRSLPTITIDFFKRPNGAKVLYDDAFSIEENIDGSHYIYMHVPDVDEYIGDNDELNDYIKSIGESRYADGYKLPLIPYDLAGKMSLLKGRDIAAISIKLHIDKNGRIIGTDFFESVVRVDENLSVTKAEEIIKRSAPYSDLMESMYNVAKNMVKHRKGRRDRRYKAKAIMDEFNIWSAIATATYFNVNNIVFPYKNYVSRDYYLLYQSDVSSFIEKENLDTVARELLKEVVSARSRDFYSTTNFGNSKFNGLPYGAVGNPLREYMSLESGRLIKHLVVNHDESADYWKEIIEQDCIEQTEKSAKVKELYKTTK